MIYMNGLELYKYFDKWFYYLLFYNVYLCFLRGFCINREVFFYNKMWEIKFVIFLRLECICLKLNRKMWDLIVINKGNIEKNIFCIIIKRG